MNLDITYLREDDGRWIACIEAIPGINQYGDTKEEAARNAKIVALQAIKWMLEDGNIADIDSVIFTHKEAAVAA